MWSLRSWIDRYRRGGFGMPEVVLVAVGVAAAAIVLVATLTRLLTLTFPGQ